MRLAVLQDSLDDPTSVRVGGENVDLTFESFDDELNVLSWHTFDSFLHNVIAVLVLDTLQNINLQLLDQFGLLISEDVLQSLMINVSTPNKHRPMED